MNRTKAALCVLLLSAPLAFGQEPIRLEAVLTLADQCPLLICAPNWDVYTVQAVNDGPAASSVSLSFSGTPFFALLPDTTFKEGVDLPTVFGFTAPESFFVLPTDFEFIQDRGVAFGDITATGIIDTEATLSATFSYDDGTPVLPANTTTTIAVLSISAFTDPDLIVGGGVATVDGREVPVRFIPEPTAACLAALACLAFARRQ